ncbi:MAG TPA: hypothetical protein DCS23_00435 [Candidatus Yonathbacteria bacterium]|nr:hypothetical protein [Candidatus Yonathbacteria bacterium]
MTPKNKIILIVSVLIVASVLGVYLWRTSPIFRKTVTFFEKPVVVTETIKVPETKFITGGEGWYANSDAYKVPLAPEREGEKVVVAGAVLSPRGAYLIALPIAQAWSADAKLVLIKSLSAVTLEGKSQGWQIVLGSRTKKKGYEVVVEGETIVSKKEVPSSSYGADVPKNFADRDAVWAIAQLATNPQFKEATMTGLNFTYNLDAKAWDYIIANSFGGTEVRVR